MNPKLIIHGGAWNIPVKFEKDHINGIKSALQQVFPLMKDGLSALDAVETAVKILESDPTYDAGKGAFLNAEGGIELDAIIVDGRNLDYGAVAGIENILHPVSVARRVMEDTDHCFLVGNGANEFAMKMGHKVLPTEALLTDRELAFYQHIKSDPSFRPKKPFEHPSDTVGAVAMDINGNLAAATSTGGTPRKLKGRVGDCPILGAGAYADNKIGAASTTGWGEGISRSLLAFRVVDALSTKDPQSAVNISLQFMRERIDGLGGVIGIDKGGQYFFGYNTPKMALGYVDQEGIITHIKP